MEEFLDEIVCAIRGRVAGGRSHREVAVELHLERSLLSRILRGERGIGMRTLNSILEADPPWLAANIPFFFKQWGGVRKQHNCVRELIVHARPIIDNRLR